MKENCFVACCVLCRLCNRTEYIQEKKRMRLEIFFSSLEYNCVHIREGGTPRKVGWECAAHFPNSLPYFWPKSVSFATLVMTWLNIRYPIYDSCAWHSCPKHNLWKAFVHGLVDNDEKAAASRKHTQFKTRVLKPYPIYDQNGQNGYPLPDQNGWKTIPFGAAHIYM